jgi:hypothetical protein
MKLAWNKLLSPRNAALYLGLGFLALSTAGFVSGTALDGQEKDPTPIRIISAALSVGGAALAGASILWPQKQQQPNEFEQSQPPVLGPEN